MSSNVAYPTTLVLPAGARLVHIGAPKTGTTALQHAASRLRPQLLENGVNYPGNALNHQRGMSVLIDRPAHAWGGGLPPKEWWATLRSQIEADTQNRIFISYEMICQAEMAQVRRVADEVGPSLHAVLVLRNFGALLPSMWQQRVKAGYSGPLEVFLKEALHDPSAVKIQYSDAFHRNDGKNLVERWCEVLGKDNVTVIVLERDHPARLFDTFEEMLELPAGLLASAPADGHAANRGMSAVEAELIRHLNGIILDQWRIPKPDHRRLVWKGAVDRMLAMRTPGRDEQGIAVPPWAADASREAGRIMADAVRSSGARVVGDLSELERRVPTTTDTSGALPDHIPTDAAINTLLGMFASAVGRDAFFDGA